MKKNEKGKGGGEGKRLFSQSCPLPVLVLSHDYHVLLRLTAEALACNGKAEVHALTSKPQPAHFSTRWIKSFTRLPPEPCGDEAKVAAILEKAQRIGTQALLPIMTEDTAFIVRNREVLAPANPVAVPDMELMDRISHKLRFTRLIKSLGFSAPRTLETTLELTSGEICRVLEFPMLAKPVASSGGVGIRSIPNRPTLDAFLAESETKEETILQERVPGEDVALTFLADRGEVFSVIMRKRWFTRRGMPSFSPIDSVEFFQCDWLEEIGRALVEATQFTGIADFDLRVDFDARRAWFLESDPRMIGGVAATRIFGVNVPWLMVEHARGNVKKGSCIRAETGHFLPSGAIAEWLMLKSQRPPRGKPIRTNLMSHLADPAPFFPGFAIEKNGRSKPHTLRFSEADYRLPFISKGRVFNRIQMSRRNERCRI